MNKKLLLHASLLLIMLAGCAVQKKIRPIINLDHQEIIAKFADLPDAPFQAKLESMAVSSQDHEQVQIFYTISMPMVDTISFYQQQMERLGWELVGQSDIQDCLLHYSKPQRFCSILITQHRLSIYLCNKKGA